MDTEFDEDVPTAMVYEALDERANQLVARYVSLHRAADSDEEQAKWWERVIAVRDIRRQVPAYDREAIIRQIGLWDDELRQVPRA
ncbi:hypothetical protein ACIRD3_32080 [Kitasatospora sp. NPDC093550]|uniref:hypothetical protein n=1 Tax=Kitasatospora sp. NPDC093550 TaxID=3364089 RepID=UPI00382844E6